MAEFEREMIDRWDGEENERRRSSGEPPHGRDWPYLTVQEISAGWAISRPNLTRLFSRTEAIREIIISGETAIYKYEGSKVPIYRIPVPVFQEIRAYLNQKLAGKRFFRDLDPGPFDRAKRVANGAARCISINGFPVDGIPAGRTITGKSKVIVVKRETEREFISRRDAYWATHPRMRGRGFAAFDGEWLTVQEIANKWRIPRQIVWKLFCGAKFRDAVGYGIERYSRGRGSDILKISLVAFRTVRESLNTSSDSKPLPNVQPPHVGAGKRQSQKR